MDNTFEEKYLTSYATFGEQYQPSQNDIVNSITKEHTLSLYAYKEVANLPDLDVLFLELDTCYKDIKKVCKKPQSHLKSAREILRIDKVKKIGYEAIPYLASHPEDWQKKGVSGFKPARLLCITNEIDYGIYENKVTKKLIDVIIKLLLKQKKELESKKGQQQMVLYSSDKNYQTKSIFGWDGAFSGAMKEIFSLDDDKRKKNEKNLKKVTEDIEFADDLLKKYCRLRASLLYRRVGDTKNISQQIHKTNLFCFNKEYNAVLKLWTAIKKFNQTQSKERNITQIQQAQQDFPQNYYNFCYASVLYTLNKMGFCQNGEKWERQDDICIEIIKSQDDMCIFFKDTSPYRIPKPERLNWPPNNVFSPQNGFLVWPVDATLAQIQSFIKANRNIPANANLEGKIRKVMSQQRNPQKIRLVPQIRVVEELESKRVWEELISPILPTNQDFTLFTFPCFEDGEKAITDYGAGENRFGFIPLSLFDVNSYRRLQKIFLKMLVALRRPLNTCPLCGGNLGGTEQDTQRKCQNGDCNLIVTRTTCQHEHQYIYLSYDKQQNYTVKDYKEWLERDSCFRYIDITPLDIRAKWGNEGYDVSILQDAKEHSETKNIPDQGVDYDVLPLCPYCTQ